LGEAFDKVGTLLEVVDLLKVVLSKVDLLKVDLRVVEQKAEVERLRSRRGFED